MLALPQGSNVYWDSALFSQKASHCAPEKHAYVRGLEVWSCNFLNPPAILQKQDCQSGLLGRRHHLFPPQHCRPACRSTDGLLTQCSFPSLPCMAVFTGSGPAPPLPTLRSGQTHRDVQGLPQMAASYFFSQQMVGREENCFDSFSKRKLV